WSPMLTCFRFPRHLLASALRRFQGRLSAGAAIVLALALFGAHPTTPLRAEDPPRPSQVVIQPGDTLSDIAVRFYGSPAAVERILSANRLSDANVIVTGTRLVLPAGTPPAASTSTRQVVVLPDDTLSGIAERALGSAAYAPTIAALNGITDENRIVAGMKLALPAAAGARSSPPPAPASPGRSLAGQRICLDPGHGGKSEPGAAYTFPSREVLREADVTLDIATTLRAWLQADGAVVTMTRTTDTFVPLIDRAAICNMAGAAIMVSVHLNADKSTAWDGAMALFGKVVDRRLAETLNAALQLGLGRNAPSAPFTAFGAQQFDGAVLLNTLMPAVIVEPVFITNPGEAQALIAPTAQATSRRNQIVLETYRGIRMYFAGS
ncbi:MAG: hypothetical protein DCC57_09520, partial [Chloroflexi bacterium]